ncbi:putative mRNA capping enzyme [Namao virus]|nr:putative mRNA capping enzyme [Namao virus]
MDVLSQYKPMVDNLLRIGQKYDEFEFVIRDLKENINYKKYIRLLKYLSILAQKRNLKTSVQDSLDIHNNIVDLKPVSSRQDNYRISIYGMENIHKKLHCNLLNKKPHVIYRSLANELLIDQQSDSASMEIINKYKNIENFILVSEYNIKARLSHEKHLAAEDLKKILKMPESLFKIGFRFKNRTSIVLKETPRYKLAIDLTAVRQHSHISQMIQKFNQYELEIDLTFFDKLSEDEIEPLKEEIFSELECLLQVLQSSNHIMTVDEYQSTYESLKTLLYAAAQKNIIYKDLPIMNASSVEIQHIVDILQNNYAITDKADGERAFFFIWQNYFYIVNNNLEIKKISAAVKTDLNGTIVDGEYTYNKKYNKFIFAAFDLLFFKEQDMRTEPKLIKRYTILYQIMAMIGNFDPHFKQYDMESDQVVNFDKIIDFYKSGITSHITSINHKLQHGSESNILIIKYFIFPLGCVINEIYKYAKLFWDLYETNLEFPYELDGLIFTPIDQIYTQDSRKTANKIFKWKPKNMNSIDFYVKFKRHPETKKILNVYDNTSLIISDEDDVVDHDLDHILEYHNNGTYRILDLYVGKIVSGQEVPTAFQISGDPQQCYIYVQDDDNVRDIEGNIIEDNTVIEFIYINDISLPMKFRWKPVRTRYDKTEKVYKYNKNYGNNENIANRIWLSIQYQIDLSDIYILSNDSQYEKHIQTLRSKIGSDIITMEKKENKYYQIITRMGEVLRDYHNFIKTNLIVNFCQPEFHHQTDKKTKLSILDFGVGRGGDLHKVYQARANIFVGVDINDDGLYSSIDGCVSRYLKFKSKYPNFPQMYFICAATDKLLSLEDIQKNKRTKNNPQSEKNIQRFFGLRSSDPSPYLFDVINCQFMIHYVFKDESSVNNFCFNVNRLLKPGGYILITCLDGELLHNKFKDTDEFVKYFTLESGDSKTMYKIIKKYNNDVDINQIGLPVNVYHAMFMLEDNYETEYLITKDLMIKTMTEKCDMELIETETFEYLYEIYKPFFQAATVYESKPETKKYFNRLKKYYDVSNNEVNQNWLEYTFINRYYIFQKKG